MAYTKQTWADLPSKTTPINANRLTHIEDGIFNAAQTADTAASTAGTAAANVGIVSGRVETLTGRVNGLDTAVSNKVDKVTGKGLSTNDYDDTDKGKVDSLGTASTKNSTSVVTQSTDLVESEAVKDIVGWGNKNLADWKWNTFTTGNKLLITLNKGTYTISAQSTLPNGTTFIRGTKQDSSYCSKAELGVGDWTDSATAGVYATTELLSSYTFSVPEDNVLIEFGRTNCNGTIPAQLEKGSTATAYEPYHESVADSLDDKIDWDDAEGYVGKNKFKISFDEIVSINTVGTWSGRTYTRQNVSFTVNDDLSITINGTNSGSGFQFLLHNRNDANNLLKAGKYKYTAEGAVSNCYVRFFTTRSGSAYTYGDIPTNGNEIVADVLVTDIQGAFINITGNAAVNNVTVKVMIREASVSDSTYQPYLISNTDLALTKADNSVIGTVEGANASKAWSVGEHFIKDGQFKEVTQAIASGGAISDSNTVNKPIADCLVKQDTFSGTTSTGGNIALGNTKKILSAFVTDANKTYIALPYINGYNGENAIHIVQANAQTQVVAEESVSGIYYYI